MNTKSSRTVSTNRQSANRAAGTQTAPLPARIADTLQSTLGLGLLGSLLVYVSLPPLNVWPLAWVAPVPWVLIIRQAELSGRRPYRAIWLAGFVFWLAAIHWLRLPHWTTYFGWLALSFYLAFYLPVFIALSRVAVHRLWISVVFAAPVVWTGLELARGHLLGGFTMASLAHTQLSWLAVIQGADIVGCYGISGLVMFVAACVARIVPWRAERTTLWPLAPLGIVLAAAVGYGHWRMSGQYTRPGPTVALIQGSIDAELQPDAEKLRSVLDEYLNLSQRALREQANLDLVVWPEAMFRYPLYTLEPDFQPPDHWQDNPEQLQRISRKNLADLQELFRRVVEAKWNAPLPPPLLLGIDAVHFTNDRTETFNSALFVDAQGNPLARYDKMHPVMFGEYIPLADWFPLLYKITPLTGGLTAGRQGVAQKIGSVRYAPNICYETVIPHLIRRQVRQLQAQGEEPDVLVNLTNDGWFRGSSELDMHLACGVFRAIELRKPLVIAANTGFSAWIDGDGRIVRQGARRAPDVIIAAVQLDTRHSPYLAYGDWFSGLCLLACWVLAVVGIWQRVKARRKTTSVRQAS